MSFSPYTFNDKGSTYGIDDARYTIYLNLLKDGYLVTAEVENMADVFAKIGSYIGYLSFLTIFVQIIHQKMFVHSLTQKFVKEPRGVAVQHTNMWNAVFVSSEEESY